ncbi:MAG: cell envelope protein SmpA [Piscirickettsiaceae bacterium]|nr:MAG: cell envelope protein SmpA [Piscirickettsiaceae bacterium]PCI68060.1 MAG: cell envelope protein SmpA [Piscirickettsiaceae bacterium]
MRKLLIILLLVIITGFLTACSTTGSLEDTVHSVAGNLPGVYKINVRQGNVITQEAVDHLRPGMDKRQVKFLLGTPLIADPFHKDRWDYFYNMNIAGKQNKQERLTVFFEGGKLISLKGSFKPSNEFKPMTINTEVVDVPKRDEKERGLFERALHAIGIEYDEKL